MRIVGGVSICLVGLFPLMIGIDLLCLVIAPLAQPDVVFAEVASFQIRTAGIDLKLNAWQVMTAAFGSLTVGALLLAAGYVVGFKRSERTKYGAD